VTPGRIWLVGAGPGDPELLTLKAVRVLGQADVVLVDDLVNRAVLEHVRPGTRIVEVGKRGGCRSTPQAFIERLMIQEAQAGHCVVRLKGGDPFVFGRGGEEMLAARAAGLAVEVVHGITSGIAAPARLGIPVTHRDATHGVAFVTGHTGSGDAPDWAALARSGLTLVVYMGVANAPGITAALMEAGLAADTPAAVVQSATTDRERGIETTLGGLVDDVAAAGLGSPAILVIGAVASLAQARGLARENAVAAPSLRAAHAR
jgi:uroporphyrin-III C-methyltransferase